ncbi:hypothetical protein ABE10_25480 [Bacillus toyonensis]|nr:hypothetical protein [Bacillus toyonensis]
MNRQKRHAGRAIRRQRRERHQVMGAVATIDWGALGALFTRAMEWLGRVVAAVASAVEDLVRAYLDAVAREHRMTYRALTTGGEVKS